MFAHGVERLRTYIVVPMQKSCKDSNYIATSNHIYTFIFLMMGQKEIIIFWTYLDYVQINSGLMAWRKKIRKIRNTELGLKYKTLKKYIRRRTNKK